MDLLANRHDRQVSPGQSTAEKQSFTLLAKPFG
jgi:hypothetical protein